jgi:hypothetical protein
MGIYNSPALSVPVVALLLLGCGTSRPQSQPANARDADPKLLALQLEEAYRLSSQEALSTFCQQWHDTAQTTNTEDIHDPVERELYLLFQEFFDPSGLNALVGNNDFSSVIEEYSGTKYVIVQNSIRYQIGEDVDAEKITISDFRPAVNVGNRRVLYLTQPYHDALVAFLGAGNPRGTLDVEEEVEENRKRLGFLAKHVKVVWNHGFWDILTPPSVDLVELDQTSKEAKVHFAIGSEGGTATMQRTAEGWHIVSSRLIWMQ